MAGVDSPTSNRVGNQLSYSEWLAATTDVTFHDSNLRRFFDRFDTGKLDDDHAPSKFAQFVFLQIVYSDWCDPF